MLSPGVEESSLASRSRACVEPASSLRRAMPSRLDVEAPVGVEPVMTIRRVEASSRDVEGQNRGVEHDIEPIESRRCRASVEPEGPVRA